MAAPHASAAAAARRGGRRCLACLAAALGACLLRAGGGAGAFSAAAPRAGAWRGAGGAALGDAARAAPAPARGLASLARRAEAEAADAVPRRLAVLPAALLAGGAAGLAPEAAFAEAVAAADLPDRISADPYELIGMANRDDSKADKQEFYMKKDYKADTYQVLKHMKISGSLDKGTPSMERWNKRIKEEMDDWVALYRRQEAVVGRQSYYTLYSAVNTLASHFTSYGPKFPFPNKRRPRFYELINTAEKYLEKNK